MLILHAQGSGSRDITLLEKYDPDDWASVKRNAVRHLEDRSESTAARSLSDEPLELWQATNDFGDDFHVLFMAVSSPRYIELEQCVGDRRELRDYAVIAKAVQLVSGEYVRFVAVHINWHMNVENDSGQVAAVTSPELKITSTVVATALRDAENLIRTSGPTSAVDRAHTALHGHLRYLCASNNIPLAPNLSLSGLFGLLRKHHPALSLPIAGRENARRLFNSMATIVEALSPMRNSLSVAHPNETLLDEAEAMLVVNAVRTLLHYLDARLGVAVPSAEGLS